MTAIRTLLLHSVYTRSRLRRTQCSGLTLVEVMIALAVLLIFFLTSTASLSLFDSYASANRNTEAARVLVDDYVNFLVDKKTACPPATTLGTDLDGDGISDGVICTMIGDSTKNSNWYRQISNPMPLIETNANPSTAVVNGTLYWLVQGVGTSFGLSANTDLMQVNFTLVYSYRGKTYFYKTTTYKGAN